MDLIKALLCGGGSTDASGSSSGTIITRPGLFDASPDVTVNLLSPGPKVAVAITGPDRGVSTLLQQQQRQQCQQSNHSVAGCDISWRSSPPQQQQPQQQPQQQHSHSGHHQQQPYAHPPQQQYQQQQSIQQRQQHQQHVWGSATSLYDMDPLTGKRNGDPIADCFAAIAYQQGAVLALADGVNWGERPKAAARGAVLGFCSSLHQQLAYAQGGRKLTSAAAFTAMRTAVNAAQQQVLQSDGTLTTLVGAVVCPKRWGGGHVLLAVCIGDSPCFVWRAATGTLEEVTYMPPLHGFHRDPRVCPGCLGYALGDQPDLSNITYSLTHLQRGDLVILTSDGIADNFDPVMRKQVLASSLPSKSPRASAAAQAAAASALNGSGATDPMGQQYADMCSPSPASCHARAMADMAKVLRKACSPQQPPSQPPQQPPQPPQQPGGVKSVPAVNGSASIQLGVLVPPHPADGSSLFGRASTASSGGGSSGLQALNTGSAGGRSSGGELPAFVAGADLTAKAAVDALMAFAMDVTDAHRKVLEDAASKGKLSRRSPEIAELLAGLPGKLDHASVVAYKVG